GRGLGLVVTGVLEGLFNGLALDVFDVGGEGGGGGFLNLWFAASAAPTSVIALRGRSCGGEAEVVALDQVAVGHGQGTLEDVLQLADVAREWVGHQGGTGALAKARRGAALFAGEAGKDVGGKHGQVVAALAQGWYS